MHPPFAARGQDPHRKRELSRLSGMSRLTVRQAIAELVWEGILYRVQGNGICVAEAEAPVARVTVPERERILILALSVSLGVGALAFGPDGRVVG